MRRSDKQIKDKAEIEHIIHASTICRLALCDGDRPYIVPLSFGYRDGILYFHSAQEGKKLDLLHRNPSVCFEFDLDCRVTRSGDVCNWGVVYRSVVGTGRATFIEDPEAKREALAVIVAQYGGESFDLPLASVNRTRVFAVTIEEVSGKQSLS